jgi:glycosyltransferase involved in cell wall biosynthesis
MSKLSVSVVIPTYNYGHYVGAAVESVLAQTYQPDEVIVVDDGSTDDTAGRLVPYMSRISYIHQHNQGLPAARNRGIKAARGKYVALLDSDDLWHPRKLESQIQFLHQSPETGLVACEMIRDIERGWPELNGSLSRSPRRFSVEDLLVRSRFGPSSVVVHRDCFDKVGLFDTGLRSAEDRDMWLRIASCFPVVKIDAPLWWYRLHGGNMSSAAVRMEENEMMVLRRTLANMPRSMKNYLLKCKVLGYTLRSAAYRYDMAGQRGRAIARVLQSMALWPFPFRRDEAFTFLERPKMLTLFALRMARSWISSKAR